jgi:methylthioribose-1-phosphate isomerase
VSDFNSVDVSDLYREITSLTAYLLTSRPTAVNLQEALTRINEAAREGVQNGLSAESLARRVIDVAKGVWSEDVERNQSIGDRGAAWLLGKLETEGNIEKGERINVLTVRIISS